MSMAEDGLEGALYRHLVEDANDVAIFVTDPGQGHRFVWLNEAACRFFGRMRTELLCCSLMDVGEGGIQQLLERYWQDAETTPSPPIQIEAKCIRAADEATPLELTLSRLTHAGKALAACQILDVSRRKRVEHAGLSSIASLLQPVATGASAELELLQSERVLAESRHFLKRVIDAIADPVFVKDRQHRWILLNKAFCELIGHSLEDLLGKSDYDFFPEHEADVFWTKDEVVFNSGEEDANEEEITSHDGVTRTIVTKKTRYTDDGGQQFLVGCIMDITARKQAEALLSRREEEFRALAENLPDPIFRYDRNCRRIYVNPAVELMCGKSTASLMGGSPDDGAILSRGDGKKLIDFIRRVLETGQSCETEIEVVAPDGCIHYYHNRYVPEWGRNGEKWPVCYRFREKSPIANSRNRPLSTAVKSWRRPSGSAISAVGNWM